jgi:oligo-1,6-glucosidase
MANIRFEHIEDYKDIETVRMYKKIKKDGGDAEAFLKDQQIAARDNSRTPFQWNAQRNSGFTIGDPWIKINGNYTRINVAAQQDDRESILQYVRKAITLRKTNRALVYGDYVLLNSEDPNVYTYLRNLGQDQFMVILNFSRSTQALPRLPKRYTVLLNNYRDLSYQLYPYQAIVLKRNK